MLAFALVIILLAYLALLGIALASLPGRNVRLALALVSPSMGIGLILPLALFLNRLGLPMTSFGLPLLAVLGVAALGWVAYRRPVLPWGELRALGLPTLVGLLMAGGPLLLFGFSWAANSNGDMGIYLASASNFLHHGFFHVPTFNDLLTGYDSPENLWYWELAPPNRYGTDAYLAVISSALHLHVYKVYMVCAVAGFVSLMLAVAALSADADALRPRRVLSVWLLAVACPLLLFTVYQQILPQLLGQSALLGVVALLQLRDASKREQIQRASGLAFVYSGLSYIYPEITPLLGLGILACAPFALYRHRNDLRAFAVQTIKVPAIAGAIFLVLINVQFFTLVATLKMLAHIGGATTSAGPGVINYYLIPSGIANMWGFLPFESYIEPWLSIAIAAGSILYVLMGVASTWLLKKHGRLSYGMALGLQLFCVFLFIHRSAYVLFKMVFLWQPFVVPIVAAAILAAAALLVRRFPAVRNRSIPATAMVVLAVAATGFSTYHYLGSTTDSFSTAEFTALHNASKDDLYGQMQSIADRYANDPGVGFRFDGLLPAEDEMASIIWRDYPIKFESLDPFTRLFGYAASLSNKQIVGWPLMTRFTAETVARHRRIAFSNSVRVPLAHDFVGAWVPPPNSEGLPPVGPTVKKTVFIQTGPNLTILNQSAVPKPFDVRSLPIEDVKNWLVLVDSDLGPPPQDFVAIDQPASIGPIEPDPLNRGHVVTTLGKGMLLEVVNPSPTVRLRLDVTATFNPHPYNDIPSFELLGTTLTTIKSPGSGSMRFLTPPIHPMRVNGRNYIAVRWNQPLIHFELPRSRLMSIFGNDIALDVRRFTLYARDISIAQGYSAAPAGISKFPDDLTNVGLEYSGIFEDGWLGPTFSARLHSRSGDKLHLRVNVPARVRAHAISVTVDGHTVGTFQTKPQSYLDVTVPSTVPGDHVVSLRSQVVEKALQGDSRPTWGRLMDLRFSKE